jgi:hypothetical protein
MNMTNDMSTEVILPGFASYDIPERIGYGVGLRGINDRLPDSQGMS